MRNDRGASVRFCLLVHRFFGRKNSNQVISLVARCPNRLKLTWLLPHGKTISTKTLYSDGDIAGDINLGSIRHCAEIDFFLGVDVVPGGGGAVDLALGCGGGGAELEEEEEEREVDCPLEYHGCGDVAVRSRPEWN